MYAKVLRLAEILGSQEQRPRICRMQRNRENHPSDSVAQYWKVTTVIPFFHMVYSELKSRFSEDKGSHYELFALVPEVIITKSSESLLESCQVLLKKWEHIMPLSSAFDSELFRWQQCCKPINTSSASMSVTTPLTSYADNTVKDPCSFTCGKYRSRALILLLKAPAHMAEKYDENRPTLRLNSYCDAWIYYTNNLRANMREIYSRTSSPYAEILSV